MTNTPKILDCDLEAATFRDCAMASSTFDNVALPHATFSNVDLSQSRFSNVNLAGVIIHDAAITGLTVLGHDVHALIQRQEAQTGTPPAATLSVEPHIFASDIEAALRFYVDQMAFQIVFTYGQPPFYGERAFESVGGQGKGARRRFQKQGARRSGGHPDLG